MRTVFANPLFKYSLAIVGAAILCALLFPEFLGSLLDASGFMPHSHCYLNNPKMIWLHVISDTLIGLAYVSISCTLSYMVFKASRSIPFHWMFLAFGLFIISCGFTHFVEVCTVWYPVYWLAGYVKVITAAASVVTAIAMFPLVPKVFSLIHAVKVSEERRLKIIAANRELESFASSISHDLRAPLRTMQGMALALQEDYGHLLDQSAQTYARKIVNASERMDELIQDLLEYSRMNLSDFALTPVDLHSVVEEALAMLAANIRDSGASVEVEGRLPALKGNRTLLLQVITNLVTNALKFVPPGTAPRVRVRAATQGDWVRVSVSDNGIGIAAHHRERIFKIFERLHSTTEYSGTGVGLAIVQRAVTRMGGTLGLDSEPGKGTTFWFDLPRVGAGVTPGL